MYVSCICCTCKIHYLWEVYIKGGLSVTGTTVKIEYKSKVFTIDAMWAIPQGVE